VTESGIHVRPLRIRDFLRLSSLRTDAVMPDHERGLFARGVPDAVLSALPITRRERRALIAFDDHQVAGSIDLVDDPVNHRWVLSRIRTSAVSGASDAEEMAEREYIWQALIEQAVKSAGAAGAKRIHAILDDDSPVIDALLKVGFTSYARDRVLELAPLSEIESNEVVRRQEPSDVWAVHHLYHQVTPRPVQYAEALTSNYWGRIMPGQARMRAYVIEDGLEIVAHCRVVKTRQGSVLYPMVHQDSRELIVPLIADVIAELGTSSNRSLLLVIPDYLQDYASRLERFGVREIGCHQRLVKYTTVARRMQLRTLEEIGSEVTEHAPAGSATLTYAPAVESNQDTHQP
jgi:hypothetical protein